MPILRRARRRIRPDRGNVPLPLALGLGLGITIVIAVPLTVWALSRSSSPRLTISSAQAVRGSDNNVAVTIDYQVHYPSTVYAASLTSSPSLTCTISQTQLTGPRTFTSGTEVAGTTQDVSGTLTIAVPPSQHSIQGSFSLACHLDRNGDQLASASGPSVVVSAPTFSSTSGSTGVTGSTGNGASGAATGTSGSAATGTSGAAGTSGATNTGGGSSPTGVTGDGIAQGFGCPNLGGTALFAGGHIDKTSGGGWDFVCNYSKDGYDAGQTVAYWYGESGASGEFCPLATAGERDDGTRTSGTLVSASKLADVTYYFYDPGQAGSVPKAGVVALAHKLLRAAESIAATC